MVGFDLDSELEAAFQELSPEERARVENGDLPMGRTKEPNPKKEIFWSLAQAVQDERLDPTMLTMDNVCVDPDAALAKVPQDVIRDYNIPTRVPKRRRRHVEPPPRESLSSEMEHFLVLLNFTWWPVVIEDESGVCHN